MNGAEVLAEALLKSADTFYTVTGYPVTELAELLHAEMTVNEKTAMEYALGDSLSKKRSVVIVKNVGLNNCADPLINATTQGLISGVLLIAGDDVDVISSQNAQDSRYYGEIAQVPVFDPDRETIGISAETALQASETFSRVSVIRVTSHLLEKRADRRT
ncbi:MAG: indolepyruvate ferredoxin oxidoreductase, partial [Methanogenium sp.]|nr:indolepyruvate ferredoxin oxidoreductase [Methanogenium sp.]